MKFILQLDETPATGNDLGVQIRKALAMIDFNIGPEPLRFTQGPIYAGDGDGSKNQRCGTWSLHAE